MSKLLSIVIPVFNMEKYIRKTLDSLVCPQIDNLDIIIVNDGSTDGSLSIAEEFASRYPGQVNIIDKQNGGHGSAWNAGVQKAEGKYLAFLDSDDWVEDIEKFISCLKSAKADLVFADCITYHECSSKFKIEKINGINPGIHCLEEGLPLKANSFRMTNFHYCIYRTSIIQGIMPLFHEKTSYDDLILFTAPVIHSASFEYLNTSFYVYRVGRNEQSMSQDVISRKIDQQESERKYAIEYAFSNISSCLCKNDIGLIVRQICATYYNFIIKLEPTRRNKYLDSWTNYVSEHIPSPSKIFEYKAYKYLPWPVCVVSLKTYHLIKRLF